MRTNILTQKYIRSILFGLLWTLIMLCPNVGNTQILVQGNVLSSDLQEPLAFVQLKFTSSSHLTYTDIDGKFSIESTQPNDTLIVRFTGYNEQRIPFSQGEYLEHKIELKEKTTELNTIHVTPGESRIVRILRKVNENKKFNDPAQLAYFECEEYFKQKVKITQFSEEIFENRAMKKIGVFEQYVDSSNAEKSLTLFFRETLADCYYKTQPKKEKRVIKGVRESGKDQFNIEELIGNTQESINFYKEYSVVFDKTFLSPIARAGLMFYDYTIIENDSIEEPFIHIAFKPALVGEPLYEGEMWIDPNTYALQKVIAKMTEGVNINYVSFIEIEQEYECIDESKSLVKAETVKIGFNIPSLKKDRDPLIGIWENQLSRKDLKLDVVRPESFFKTDDINLEEIIQTEEDFWTDKRHEELEKTERDALVMMDSLRNNATYRFYKKMLKMAFTGYWNLGKIELGNLYTLYNYNSVEKNRIMLSFRTSSDWNEKMQLSGFVGYGTGDQVWKYEGRYRWKSLGSNYEYLDIGFRKKVEQLGLIEHIDDVGNAFTTLVSNAPQDKLTLTNKSWIHFEKAWNNWFRTSHAVHLKQYDLLGAFVADEMSPPNMMSPYHGLTSFQIKNQIIFAKNERFIGGRFEQFSLGSEIPIVTFTHTLGLKGPLESNYNFHQFDLVWKHNVPLGWFGKSEYAIQVGKIIGDVDFPFLHVHQGNETFYLQRMNFNLMRYYEFISDEWIDVFYEHNFQGLILNRIPLIKRLKMRMVYTAKLALGRYSQPDTNLDLPEFSNTLTSPYIEMGIGLDNIARVIRVDAVWRLNPQLEQGSNFGIRFKFSPQF